MARTRAYRPAIQPLEERVVLSLSFSKLLHSVFPFLENDDPKPLTSAQRAKVEARRAHLAVQHDMVAKVPKHAVPAGPAALARGVSVRARTNGRTAIPGASTTTTSSSDIPVYGPYLTRPGAARALPAEVRAAFRAHGLDPSK